MKIRNDITLSDDHKSVYIGSGTWVELPRRIEDFAFINPQCEGCPKETFLSCIQLETVNRRANCEMATEAARFSQGGGPPQSGQLLEEHLRKHGLILKDGQLVKKPPEVAPAPAPAPEPKKGFVDKIKGLVM